MEWGDMMISDLYIESVRLKEVKVRSDSYVFQLPVVKNLKELPFHKKVTFLAGENGTRKSTLVVQ